MNALVYRIQVETTKAPEFVDITQQVTDFVRDSQVRDRVFRFPDFARSLAFTSAVGDLAEGEGHHPRLVTEWGRVTVTWWTHKIRNLHRNDFIMAAKADEAYKEMAEAR